MCTIITIFEHTLSDNHGAVDVLLCSTTITVDTHFLDSLFPHRMFSVLFSLSLFSLWLGTWAWTKLKTEYCTHKINSKNNTDSACIQYTDRFILNVYFTFEASIFVWHHHLPSIYSCAFLSVVYFYRVCSYFFYFSKPCVLIGARIWH